MVHAGTPLGFPGADNLFLLDVMMKIQFPPQQILNLCRFLEPLPFEVERKSGIYFLCHLDQVVYVGQSVNPIGRVQMHLHEARRNNSISKIFDRAYLLPVPVDQLNEAEAAFIRILKPKYQGRKGNGELIMPSPSRRKREALYSRRTGW